MTGWMHRRGGAAKAKITVWVGLTVTWIQNQATETKCASRLSISSTRDSSATEAGRWWRRLRWRDSCGCSPAVPETQRIPEIRLMEVPLSPRSPTRVHRLPVVTGSCFRGGAAPNFSGFPVRILRTCWMRWYEQPLCTGWFSWLAPGFLLVISMSLSTSLVVICQGTFQNYTFWVPGKALIILCNVSFKNNYCFFYINFMLLFKSKFVGCWWKFFLRIKFWLCNFEISPVDISSFVLSKPNWLVLSVRKNI